MKLLLFVAIIAITLVIGESYECYYCQGCDDPLDTPKTGKKTCLIPVCAKVKVLFEDDKSMTARMCAESMLNSTISRATEPFPTVTTIYTCKGDLCNGATSISSVSVLLSISTILTMKLFQ